MKPAPSPSTVQKITEGAHDAADKIADKAENTVDSARLYANEALDKADAKVRSLREDVQPAIDAISHRVHGLAARQAAASETGAQARDKFKEYSEKPAPTSPSSR